MSILSEEEILLVLKHNKITWKLSVIIKLMEVSIIVDEAITRDEMKYAKDILHRSFPSYNFNIIATEQKKKIKIDAVQNLLVISSCKGGVGKSTITALLAYFLTSKGLRVGILDADIYGPSIPHLFGLNSSLEIKENKFIPHQRDKIKIISMGNMVNPEKAVVWRGPMVTKTLYQMLIASNWGELDILLIDTPPGTGDVMLSLLEKYYIMGSILITTPHLLSTNELIKSVDLFRKLDVSIIGIIENMSYYLDSNNNKNEIFGKSNLAEIVQEIDILAKIPFYSNLDLKDNKVFDDRIFTEIKKYLAPQ